LKTCKRCSRKLEGVEGDVVNVSPATELADIFLLREGNGRIARLLAIIMALQARLPFLDFSYLKDQKKDEYFAAVRSGLERDYKSMEKIFNDVIYRSLKSYDEE